MKIEPILDKVILKEIKKKENITKNGIILPASVKEMPCEGKVVAVNKNFKTEDNLKLNIDVGDIVLFPNYSAMEFYYNDEIYIVINANDILCKIIKED